jgi:hypothetical protein
MKLIMGQVLEKPSINGNGINYQTLQNLCLQCLLINSKHSKQARSNEN